MMKQLAATTFFIVLTAAPLAAQGRNERGRVPAGHMPPAGECRVWHDGRSPGHQPAPTSCAEAQRVAARTGGRVIYGDERIKDKGRGKNGRNARVERGNGGGGRGERDDRGRDRDDIGRDDRRGTDDRRPTAGGRDTGGRAIPRTERRPTRSRDDYARSQSAGYQNGHRDGLVKGRDDADDGSRYDPNRHAWYRSADRGYNTRHGSRASYRSQYQAGFLAGYDDAFNPTNFAAVDPINVTCEMADGGGCKVWTVTPNGTTLTGGDPNAKNNTTLLHIDSGGTVLAVGGNYNVAFSMTIAR
ncbi:MAG: hypothetical protein WD690_10215 [Vicinamibacterales bacterium]